MDWDDYRRDADRQQIDAGGKVVAAIVGLSLAIVFAAWLAFGWFEVLPLFIEAK